MGKIKEVFIELKREYKDFDDEDLPYLFEQYVKKNYPEQMKHNNIFTIHKDTAIKALEGIYPHPDMFSREQLKEALERHYASKNRQYTVVSDNIELKGQCINNINEF